MTNNDLAVNFLMNPGFSKQFLLVCIITVLGISPGFALENVTLQLKWIHQFQFAGYYAASVSAGGQMFR